MTNQEQKFLIHKERVIYSDLLNVKKILRKHYNGAELNKLIWEQALGYKLFAMTDYKVTEKRYEQLVGYVCDRN